MRLVIVTGASRGLGAALVDALLDRPGQRVLGLARQAHPHLPAADAWRVDLAEPAPVAERLQQWLAAQDPAAFAEAVLVNNAALLTPPGPIDTVAPDQLAAALRVGLEAPLLLARAFLAATRAWPGARKLLNISSGLGRHAMAGSAPYCAVKGGLDHLSRALALDEAAVPDGRGARVVSLAPGIIDTDMQQQLRGADPERFAAQPRFAAFHAEGQLDSPAAAAAKLLRFLDRADFGTEVTADLRSA